VIVLDFSLPRTNGLEVLNELRRRGIDIPVLIMSGDESGRAAKAAIQAGAKGFVPKQAGLSEMEHAIDEIARGGTYLSPSIAANNNAGPGQDACASSAVLSNREREIMILLANGKPNREIGKLLSISVRTVDTHRSNILKKLGFKTNAELVKLAIAEGWVST
jgi:DNA-binding NarL/FixJ family response regulator